MTVAKLIALLSDLPQHAEVLMWDVDAIDEVLVSGVLFDDEQAILQSDEI